ncbi:hypothetical protein ABMZ87_17790 [Morganella morganii]|uniref:hypothetical protein n=1 Tax=Morganella morganii TaxID=582 RepID=UPI003EBAAF82
MKLNDIPKLMPVPFGVSGPRTELLQSSPAGDRKASYKDGFPPITMLLKSAGGLPPDGGNMNQILFELASGQRWSNAGAGYKFNATFSDAVGGYPKGAQLLSNDGTKVYVSTKDDNKTDFNTSPGPEWVTLGDYIGLGDYATKTDVGLKLDKTAVVQTTGSSTISVMSQDVTTRGLLAKVNTSDVTDSTGTDSVKVMSQKAVTEELNKKFNKNEVLQNVGASTTQVMSQDASTRLFSLKTDLPKLPLIGNGASRSGVTSSRELGVTYTNNRPYSIFVTVMLQSTARDSNLITRMRISDTPASNFYVGTRGSDADILAEATHSQLVLPGERYVVTSSPNSKIVSWVEIAQ